MQSKTERNHETYDKNILYIKRKKLINIYIETNREKTKKESKATNVDKYRETKNET